MNWIKWLLKLYPNLVASISAPLRKSLIDFATNFKVEAAKTENPWDDFAAEVLCHILGINGKDRSGT